MPIPLRQNNPMQRGFGPRMMAPGRQGGMPFQRFNQSPQMGFPMRGGPQGSRGGAGIISRLLGRGATQNAIPSMGRSVTNATGGGGGILQALTNPESISGFLNNTQTFLKHAQQFGPVIQQYGPLVRNLPSLWKLYRGLSSTTEDNDVKTESNLVDESVDKLDDSLNEESSEEMVQKPSSQTKKKKKSTNKKNTNSSNNSDSIPKLYI